MNEQTEAVAELDKLLNNMQALTRKIATAAYNLERSFVDNVKEISGTGWTQEEAKERYGL